MKLLTTSFGALFIALAMLVAPANASTLCVNTQDCTLELTQGNSSSGFGTGNFGTVRLQVTGTDQVEITVSLNNDWDVIQTGFPGVVGFTDSLTTTASVTGLPSGYSGSQFDSTQDLHFDGFGYENSAVGTTGPHNGDGLQSISFTITQSGLNDVNDLLNLSGPKAGDGAKYFIVDAGIVCPPDVTACTGSTGLLGVTGTTVPEPTSYAVVLGGLGALIWTFQRRKLVTRNLA